MARETKIGLIVGMGVIIFIGILVSETLNAPPTDATQPQFVRMMNANEPPAQQVQQPLYARSQQPENDDRAGNAGVVHQVDNTVQHQPTDPPTGDGHVADPPKHTTRHTIHELLGLGETTGTTETGTENTSAGGMHTETTTGDPAPPVNRQRVHHVQDGETLYELAKKYYGNGGDWPLIAKANEGKVGANGSVRKGVRLVIPDKPGQPIITPTPPTPPSPMVAENTTPTYKTYTIAKGDLLGNLSLKFYGTSRKWKELYELNKDRIENPNVLVVGAVIRVPAIP